MALSRAQLDTMICDSDGCIGDHDAFYIHSRCHRDAPTWATYKHGELVISCCECESPIISIAVAEESKSAD